MEIPNYPKIPLGNYLTKLVNESDTKDKSIYIKNCNELISGIWNEMISRKNLKVRELIPKEFGVTVSVFYAYKNGRKRPPIQLITKLLSLWKKICNKSQTELELKMNEIFEKARFTTHSKHQKVELPKYISPRLSYLMGWMCGDGNLQIGGNHYCVKISEKSKQQLSEVLKPLFDQVFGTDIHIYRRYQNGHAIQMGSKVIYRFFRNVLRLHVGGIPSIVETFDGTNLKYFIAGVFDAEGHVGKLFKDKVVFSQADKSFLEKIGGFLNRLGINYTGPYRHQTINGVWYTIRIKKNSEAIKYFRIVGSFHVDKSKKMEEVINQIENRNSNFTPPSR